MPENLMDPYKLFLAFLMLDNTGKFGQTFFIHWEVDFFSQKLVFSTTS